MPRRPRFDLPGVPQHVIQRGVDRQPVFFSDDDCRLYLDWLQLWADIDLNHSRDRSGYSPFLESGRLRVITRTSSRIEYQYPLAINIQWAIGAEWVNQRSSLALFENRSRGPYLALRSAW